MQAVTIARHSLLLSPVGRWLLPLLAFLGICAATVAFAYHLHQENIEETRIRFSMDAALITVEMRDRLRQHAQFLRGLRAFVSSLPSIGPKDWQRFAELQESRTHQPGIQAYGFVPAVSPAGQATFLAQARQLLQQPHYRIHPELAPDVQSRFPVLLLWPMEGSNLRGMGYDMASEPTRLEAMHEARDRDMVIMTRRLQLMLDDPNTAGPGLLLYLPIYAPGLPAGTVEERRIALRGFVFAAYRISDFMQTLNYTRNPRIALKIYDDWGYDSQRGGAQLALLHDTHPDWPDRQTPGMQEERELSFGNRTWLLQFEDPMPEPLFSLQDPATIALVSGQVLAVLTALLLWILARQGEKAMSLAAGMTEKLEASEQIFRLAAEGANDGLWHRDFRKNRWFFSERARALLGHPPDPSPADTGCCILFDLAHPDDVSLLHQAFDNHLRSRSACDVELRLQRADASWGWFQIKGQATWDAQGRPLLMAGSLSDIQARKTAEMELRAHHDRLQELVEERTARLEGALQEARDAVRTKSEFLANMSHELRTPLHAMLGFASIGLGKSENDPRMYRYFERIQQSADRLLRLVNDLLDLAKLEASKMEVQPRLQDVVLLLPPVLVELDSLIQKKQLQVDISVGAGVSGIAMVDSTRFAQVLNNLLSNAIRFSPEGGRILLSFHDSLLPRGRRASDQGTMAALALWVEDQGPGIPPDELEVIFDKFAQSSRTRTGAGGTGLGLAICREIMSAHRGRIHAENQVSGGARLIATLPREGEAPTQEETKP